MDTSSGASRCGLFLNQRRLVDQLGRRIEGEEHSALKMLNVSACCKILKPPVSNHPKCQKCLFLQALFITCVYTSRSVWSQVTFYILHSIVSGV